MFLLNHVWKISTNKGFVLKGKRTETKKIVSSCFNKLISRSYVYIYWEIY